MNIYEPISEYVESGRKGVLATVVRRTGSAPRDVGAKMFIGEDGRILGTIGGGGLEFAAQRRALAMMGSGVVALFTVAMEGRDVKEDEMLCGGNVEVLFEPVDPSRIEVYRKIRDALKMRGRGVVVTRFAPGSFGKSLVDGEMAVAGDVIDDVTLGLCKDVLLEKKLVLGDGVLIEPLRGSVPLYLFGAGHVAQFVATIAHMADFDVTVIDDRPDFANKERFPDATAVLVAPLPDAFRRLPFTGEEYVVILTRGHQFDAEVLTEAMKTSFKYVGMIGSSRKVSAILDHLRDLGFSREAIDLIHAPIGIPIAAETPQEVAIAVGAELVNVRNGGVPDKEKWCSYQENDNSMKSRRQEATWSSIVKK